MENQLNLYNEIMLVSLRPWMNRDYSEAKFIEMTSGLKKDQLAYPSLFTLSFIKPLNAKTKYYTAIIEQEAIQYLNSIHQEIETSLNDNERKYWVNKSLTKKLHDKLHEIEKTIISQNLFLSVIADKKQDKSKRDEAFVIQLLKWHLIWLYLEIQYGYPSYQNEDPVSEEDLHTIYFSEEPPTTSFITRNPVIEPHKASNALLQNPLEEQEEGLNAVIGDIRESNNSILKYSEIIAKPETFALVERELFHMGLLNLKYSFIKRKGNNEKLAAVVHLLILKSHFKPFSFTGGRKVITELHIRKFLGYRYSTSIDKEFRVFKETKMLENYLNNHPLMRQTIPS